MPISTIRLFYFLQKVWSVKIQNSGVKLRVSTLGKIKWHHLRIHFSHNVLGKSMVHLWISDIHHSLRPCVKWYEVSKHSLSFSGSDTLNSDGCDKEESHLNDFIF